MFHNSDSDEDLKEVRSPSLKESKKQNPLNRSKKIVGESLKYVKKTQDQSEHMVNSNNKGSSLKYTEESQMVSSYNDRSTLPLNEFYGEVINHIKKHNNMKVKEVLEECSHQFYEGIDEMQKTVLHIAWEK